MSGCALRRWGPGTPCEKSADTPAAKEMAAKLAAIKAEREKQDQRWMDRTTSVVSQPVLKNPPKE
jgi:hypothetical protein